MQDSQSHVFGRQQHIGHFSSRQWRSCGQRAHSDSRISVLSPNSPDGECASYRRIAEYQPVVRYDLAVHILQTPILCDKKLTFATPRVLI
jgi:hypothetical protein